MTLSAFCPRTFVLNDRRCHDAYEASLRDAICDAKRLNCKALITQVGMATEESREVQHDNIVLGLRRMQPILEDAGVTLMVEPLNDVKDHPGYYLTSSEEGFEIIKEVNSPKVRLLFDIYHQLHMGEDVLAQIANHLDLIAHFHVAGYPNRDDAITKNFDYRAAFELVNSAKSPAPMGLELFPKRIEDALSVLSLISDYR
jgi:hydroxypyruvate isomerase